MDCYSLTYTATDLLRQAGTKAVQSMLKKVFLVNSYKILKPSVEILMGKNKLASYYYLTKKKEKHKKEVIFTLQTIIEVVLHFCIWQSPILYYMIDHRYVSSTKWKMWIEN